MNAPRWAPNVTVAAIIEADGRYLLVEEQTADGLRLNNPAGHLEPGESPEQGVVREALEETMRAFVPEALVGVYLARLRRHDRDVTYLRFAYTGPAGDPLPGRVLDQGIVRTVWLTIDEVRARVDHLRTPLVLRCLEDHAAGCRHPLQLLTVDPSLYASAPPSPAPGARASD